MDTKEHVMIISDGKGNYQRFGPKIDVILKSNLEYEIRVRDASSVEGAFELIEDLDKKMREMIR